MCPEWGRMNWIDVLVSIATGVLLWALLPRGVVLTRARRTENAKGDTLHDTWEIKNDSPLPVRLTSVRVVMPGHEGDMPWDGGPHGLTLRFDDDTAEIAREDWQRPWNHVVVRPGDTLEAHVPNNITLMIEYRRAGWSGVFERRKTRIDGLV